ncbi:MAG: hypothetical protein JNL50_04455 [Phycisphaerae bacterium]|nr:hypothetical protein [Phycisphaerae bacterium]
MRIQDPVLRPVHTRDARPSAPGAREPRRPALAALRLATFAGLAVGLAAAHTTAHAAIINWNNAAGGAASVAANWNPALVPTAADTLVYNLNNTYTVTFSSSVPLSTQHTYKRGTVTLSMSSPHTLSGNFRVGDVSGDAAATIITTGVVNAASVTVGNAAGSTGTLNITDSDADLVTTGGGDIVVASAGTGTMNLTGGGKAAPGDDFIIGGAGGDGTVNVSGLGTTPIRFSNITTTAADGDIVVGNASGSVGELNVFGGGIIGASDDVQVGLVGGSSGVLDVGGSGSGLVNVAGDLQVGNNSSSTSAGSGQVSALNGGTINVSGAIRLGDTTVGSGTLSCRDGGEINAHSIICDSDGGFLNLLGGETRVDGGTLTAPNSILSLEGSTTETPFLRLLNGASCSLSAPVSPFRALTVGINNDANLVVDTGSSLTVSSGDVVVGDLPAAQGSLVFSGGSTGTFPATRRITLGASAFGDMVVTGDSTVTGGSMELGAGSSGNGSLLVYSSDLTLAGTLTVGGTPTFDGGVGEVRVEASGTITVNATGDAVIVFSGGSVLIFPGATLSAPFGTVQIGSNAELTLDNGSLRARLLNIGALNPSLRGTLAGQVIFSASSMVVNPTGPLTIDGGVASFALNSLGTINVGNTMLTINAGTGHSSVGNCTIGPAGVIDGTAPLANFIGKTISGDGTINNDILNEGTITATGDGLAFGGIVENAGGAMNGVRFTFLNGGGFTGAGTIASKIVGELGSKLTFTANASIGDASTTGFSTSGELEVSGASLTINDSNGIGLGALTTLRGSAILTCPTEIALGNTPTLDVLAGSGTIVTPSLRCAGVIRPGDPDADRTGLIAVQGPLVLNAGSASGQFNVEIAGPNQNDIDELFVSGAVTLDGALNVQLVNAFVPDNGYRRRILLTSAAVAGTFATENLPQRFHVEYLHSIVNLVYCAGDVNSDGFVNGDDFDDLASAFENGEPLGDFNGDGFINGDDFDEFAGAFEEGC